MLTAAAPETMTQSSWEDLVTRIQNHDAAALQELHDLFATGTRFLLLRNKLDPTDIEDKVHDIFIIVAQAIANGELREPARLVGFIHTIVRRQIAAYIDQAVKDRSKRVDFNVELGVFDQDHDPESKAIETEQEALATRILRSLPERDREVLVRFYLEEQTPAEICGALNLTATQFRLIKSRAKARFGELGQARLRLQAPATRAFPAKRGPSAVVRKMIVRIAKSA